MTSPSMAFAGMLGGLGTTTRTLSQRARWTGAVQSQVFDDVSSPIALPSAVVTSLLEVQLDPGRWLVFAGLVTVDSSSSAPAIYQVDAWLNEPTKAPFRSSTSEYAASPGFFTGAVVSMSRLMALEVAATVSLTAMATTTVTTVAVRFAYLVAAPL
jgi:hypothetical protein